MRAHTYKALCAPNTSEPHLGLDQSLGQVCIDGVRSLPIDRNEGNETAEQSGRGPNYPAIIQCFLQFQARIRGKDMIFLLVDNRDPGEVPHWPAFEKWWLSRCRCGSTTKTLMFCGLRPTQRTGVGGVPHYWEGLFVLEVARFMNPPLAYRQQLCSCHAV